MSAIHAVVSKTAALPQNYVRKKREEGSSHDSNQAGLYAEAALDAASADCSEEIITHGLQDLPGIVFILRCDETGTYRFSFITGGCAYILGADALAIQNSPWQFFQSFDAPDALRLLEALKPSNARTKLLQWEGKARGQRVVINAILRRQEGAIEWIGQAISFASGQDMEIELRESREQLALATIQREAARETERERIARDIHDELGSILVRAKFDVALLTDKLGAEQSTLTERTTAIEMLLMQALATVQNVSRQLRPGILKEFGLVEAIKNQVEDFSHSTGITCQAQYDSDLDPDSQTALALFRIAQEALTNVAKHAGASMVLLKLCKERGNISLEITDNGRGYTDAEMQKPGSFGLRGIRERVESLAGAVDIFPAPLGGTSIILTVPERISVDGSGNIMPAQGVLF